MKLSSAIILTVCLVGCACAVKWTKYIKIPAFDDRMCPADYVGFQTDARSKASCAVRCNGSPGCRGVIYLHDNGTCYLITADNAFDTSTTLTGAVFFKAILDCPNVTAVTHGRVQGGEFSVGSTVAASCDPGYILNGPEQRTCEPAGTWSDGIPECLEDPGCLDPMVGLSAAHGVADSQLSASSYWCDEVHGLHGYYPEAPDCLAPRYARLNATGWHTGAWAPYYVPNNTEWIQVNFNEPRVISAIVLKGRDPVVGVGDNYVTGFEVSISSDCNFWTTLADETGSPVVFPGTTGPDVTVQDHLTERVVASCMRIHPVTWYGLICLRFDVLGCLPVVTLEGMRLWFVTRAVTHDEAQSACSSVGALVMLDTASKMDALRAYLLDTNNGYRHTNFWVQGRYDVTDDAWEYNDGTPLLEGYWGPDQPVSGGSAYCVQLWASADFAFDDYRCDYSAGFICEYQN